MLYKVVLKLICFCLAIILFIRCGGVIGNIEQYDYPITPQELKTAIKSLFTKHPEWISPIDSSIHQLNGKYFRGDSLADEFYFYYKDPKPMLLNVHIIINKDTTFWMPTISLTTGAYYGDTLFFARDIKRADRKLFQKTFEAVFLKELNKELNVEPE